MEGRQAQGKGTQRVLPVEKVIERVCQVVGVRAEELRGSGRRAAVSRARAGVAYLWLEGLGQSEPGAARALGVHRGDDLRGGTAWPSGGGLLGAALRRGQTRISLQRPLDPLL
jgi:hypothetical protein